MVGEIPRPIEYGKKRRPYIEQEEAGETAPLSKFEIVELFFEWLKKQPPSYQMSFLKKALK